MSQPRFQHISPGIGNKPWLKAMNFVTLHSNAVKFSCSCINYMALIGEYIKNLIQLVFAPEKGWEDIEGRSLEDNAPDGTFQRNAVHRSSNPEVEDQKAVRDYYQCFLPLAALCGSSAFVRLFYSDALDFLGAFQRALITFVTLFLASQIARFGFLYYLPRLMRNGMEISRARVLNMIMYCLTFLGMITLMSNIVKVRIALIEFLPFYVIFIIWKGWKYLGVDERHEGIFMILATALILGSVYIISFILNSLL